MAFKKIVGFVLTSLVLSSALLCVGSIWGKVSGDTVGKFLTTFFVIGTSTIGLSYITKTFIDSK